MPIKDKFICIHERFYPENCCVIIVVITFKFCHEKYQSCAEKNRGRLVANCENIKRTISFPNYNKSIKLLVSTHFGD